MKNAQLQKSIVRFLFVCARRTVERAHISGGQKQKELTQAFEFWYRFFFSTKLRKFQNMAEIGQRARPPPRQSKPFLSFFLLLSQIMWLRKKKLSLLLVFMNFSIVGQRTRPPPILLKPKNIAFEPNYVVKKEKIVLAACCHEFIDFLAENTPTALMFQLQIIVKLPE